MAVVEIKRAAIRGRISIFFASFILESPFHLFIFERNDSDGNKVGIW